MPSKPSRNNSFFGHLIHYFTTIRYYYLKIKLLHCLPRSWSEIVQISVQKVNAGTLPKLQIQKDPFTWHWVTRKNRQMSIKLAQNWCQIIENLGIWMEFPFGCMATQHTQILSLNTNFNTHFESKLVLNLSYTFLSSVLFDFRGQ